MLCGREAGSAGGQGCTFLSAPSALCRVWQGLLLADPDSPAPAAPARSRSPAPPCRYEKARVEPELHGFGDELLKKFDETEQSLLTVR